MFLWKTEKNEKNDLRERERECEYWEQRMKKLILDATQNHVFDVYLGHSNPPRHVADHDFFPSFFILP